VGLDIARVDVERYLLAAHDQRVHALEQRVQHQVELGEVANVEAARKAPQRGRIRQPVAAQPPLSHVRAQQPRVVQTVAAGGQRRNDRHRRLRRREAPPAALHGHAVEQLAQTQPAGQLAHQHQPGMCDDLLARTPHLDSRRTRC
jgi:hypothetical protein